MRSFLLYTSARFLVLVASLGVLYLMGARGVLLLGLALLVSGLLSYLLLARQRDVVAGRLQDRVRRVNRRIEESSRAEDEADERARRETGDTGDAADTGDPGDGVPGAPR